jgi:phosphate uptake regulator
MDIRKIERAGGSTYIVPLLKQWVNLKEVTSGMNMGITILPDGTLLIIPNTSSPFPLHKKLDVSGKTNKLLIEGSLYPI